MKISNDVLLVLESAIVDGNNLTLTGQLDRKMYVAVNKVLEAAGGKWNKKLKVHVFDTDASERIEEILLTGEVEVPKDDFDFFPTPQKVVEAMIDVSGIRVSPNEDYLILEPSGGRGAISDVLFDEFPNSKVIICELSPSNFEFLEAKKKNHGIQQGDFLDVGLPLPTYDYVFMNPPFGKQKDITHVTQAMKWLKTGGTLVAIMASSVLYRNNKKTVDFRQLVEDNNGSIIKLPDNSFKESGTSVGTVMVKMVKV